MRDERIGELAYRALIAEVEVTPKPGLVDRAGNGAHRDMDIDTFYRSAEALRPHFVRFSALGREAESPDALFPVLREAGKLAERDMFAATEGANTHRGALFSIGLICGAAGYHAGRHESPTPGRLCDTVAEMTRGIVAREYGNLDPAKKLTHGERMYLTYGATGVRGEAESGFLTVREVGLPTLLEGLAEGRRTVNEVLLLTLVTLMARAEDTNILARHDGATAEYVKQQARWVLDRGCSLAAISDLDRDLTERYISPGGTADLLAVTILLFTLQENLDILIEETKPM